MDPLANVGRLIDEGALSDGPSLVGLLHMLAYPKAAPSSSATRQWSAEGEALTPIPTASQAVALAEPLLVSLHDRWRHVQAVGRKAERLSCTVADSERQLLVAAAWLHDIGYALPLVDTGLHALDGARFLERIGCDGRLCALVAHHSGARFEAEERGLSDELAVFPLEDSPVMDALVVADFTTGPQGQDLDYDARLDEVLDRYEPGNPVHRAVIRGRELLRPHVERVAARLAQPT